MDEWVIQVENEVQQITDLSAEMKLWMRRSIYVLPANVTLLNKIAYRPRVVSIGPYHHGQEDLKTMEEHKHRALLHFIKRSRKPLKSYIDALAEVVEDLKNAYDQLNPAWQENNAFLKMMVLDGCFILEVLRMGTHSADDYAPNDPIFSNHGSLYILPLLKRDMLLVENQVPLQVIVKLLAVADPNAKEGVYLSNLLCRFFSTFDPCPVKHSLHLLDAYRKSLLRDAPKLNSRIKSKHHIPVDSIIPSATKLQDAGIRIMKSKTVSLRDISFHGKTLRLPKIIVDNDIETKLLNLMAFERLHVGTGNEVTSYIVFLDALVQDSKDVSLLCSRGIIYNALGSDKSVAYLFRSISEYACLDPESDLDLVYREVSYKLRNRFRKRMHEWRADLVRTYFRSPWAAVSVIAAILLFSLTMIQTVCSVLSVIHRD